MMHKEYVQNIILIDFPKIENWEFKNALNKKTGIEWEEIVAISNKSRKNKIYNVVRYFKYFSLPFNIFFHRKKYKNIIAWQQFYGLIYAFYCRIFNVKKVNNLIIMTFIYKEKKGFIGKIYSKFMQYSVQSKYIDSIVCFSKEEINLYSQIFKKAKEKFILCHLGIEKINIDESQNSKEKTILSCGRSNRDYNFLYNALKDTNYKLDIISDECNIYTNCSNITIHNNINGQAYFEMLNKCYIVVIPLENKKISSGQLVCLQAMQLGKPVICTESDTIRDYIQDGINGFIIEKENIKLLDSIKKLFNDKELYDKISSSEKKFFNENCSLSALGEQIGTVYNNNCKKIKKGNLKKFY